MARDGSLGAFLAVSTVSTRLHAAQNAAQHAERTNRGALGFRVLAVPKRAGVRARPGSAQTACVRACVLTSPLRRTSDLTSDVTSDVLTQCAECIVQVAWLVGGAQSLCTDALVLVLSTRTRVG